jgi:predicted neuraminidase
VRQLRIADCGLRIVRPGGHDSSTRTGNVDGGVRAATEYGGARAGNVDGGVRAATEYGGARRRNPTTPESRHPRSTSFTNHSGLDLHSSRITHHPSRVFFLLVSLSPCLLVSRASATGPAGELIAPLEATHNHGSCVVECPNGDLLACWYRGSGERQSDDVRIVGSRKKRGAKEWSPVFDMADTPGFPDCNPCMIVDPSKRLWMFWPVILDNHWESALLKYRRSRRFEGSGAPKWDEERTLLLKPGQEFAAAVTRDLAKQSQPFVDRAEGAMKARLEAYLADVRQKAATKLSVRLGWMPRAHPFLDGKRLILPLYSDGFNFSMMAYTDDEGASWQTSEPLVGPGNVQPSIAKRKDGTLVAFFRDNGPPPQRVMKSESRDGGKTWSLAADTELPDPGAGLEVLALKSGRWLLINNPTENGRHALGIHVSEDEGKTWGEVGYIENDKRGSTAGSYSYPSIIQAHDGMIHVTYSYSPSQANTAREGKGESIKHVQFTESELIKGWQAR